MRSGELMKDGLIFQLVADERRAGVISVKSADNERVETLGVTPAA
jgi:hypothetical protein